MTLPNRHLEDETLLLHADGELTGLEAAHVRQHLEDCEHCRDRLAAVGDLLAVSTTEYRSIEPAMDSSGPHALLRARLAEEIGRTQTGKRWHLGLVRGLAFACALALLAVTGVQVAQRVERTEKAGQVGVAHPERQVGMLPDPGFTPGSTRAVTLAEVCAADRDEVVREVPAAMQQKVFQEYGIKDKPAKDFEVDYLITPGLGGSDDVRNLWPEPHAEPVWNSYVKDQLEDHLHHMVCHGQLSLQDAQQAIAGNWINAYKKYFHTERPLASRELSQL